MSTSAAQPLEGPDPRPYLEHLEWVRALALRIVGDPEEADELRQEVWLLAQRLDAPRRVPARAWLGGLLRNVVRDRRRSRAVRLVHEERAALERALDAATPGIVREVSVQQVVVERVMALPEPYRTTVLGRYFEDLSPGELADRDGVPVATVKTRLRRALGVLRDDLAERRVRGVSALAILALNVWRPDTGAAAAATGAGVAGYGLAGTAVAAAVAIGVLAASESVEIDAGRRGASPEALALEDVAPGAPTARSAASPEIEDAAADAAPGPVATTGTGPVAATVVDLAGAAVRGAQLRWVEIEDGRALRRTPWVEADDEGVASLPGSTGAGAVACALDGWLQFGIPLFERAIGPDERVDALVVMAPAVTLRGVVLGAGGAPIEGARVEVGLLGAYAARIGRPLDDVVLERFSTRTDRDGRFALSVPADERGLGVRVSSVGRRVLRSEIPSGEFDLEQGFVLRPLTAEGALFGVVVDGSGDPLARAWVAAGGVVVRADALGRFQLGTDPDDDRVLAGAPGKRPVRVPLDGLTSPLRIRLDEPSLSIEGVVVDAAGEPVEGLVVAPTDASLAGAYSHAESGRRVRVEVPLESFGQADDGEVAPRPVLGITGADGSFRIDGLAGRSYALEVTDPRTLARSPAGAHEAGARGLVLRAPAPQPSVDFEVVDERGGALAGVEVRATVDDGVAPGPGLVAVSGPDGRVRFPALAPEAVLRARSEDRWIHAPLRAADAAASGRLRLEAAARIQLVVPAEEGAFEPGRTPRTFEVRDATGARLDLVTVDLDAGRTSRSFELGDPIGGQLRPLPFLVSTRARELVLLDEQGPLFALPLDLEPGERALVRP